MKTRVIAVLMVFAVLGAFVLAPLQASAKPALAPASAPAIGTMRDTATSVVTPIASITLLRFVSQNGQLAAVIQLLDAAGNVLRTITVPVTADATCEILTLVLGPL